MDKEMQIKLKMAMAQLEAACETMEIVVEACCEDPMKEEMKSMLPKRNKFLSIDTGSSSEE